MGGEGFKNPQNLVNVISNSYFLTFQSFHTFAHYCYWNQRADFSFRTTSFLMPWQIGISPGKTGPTLLFDPLDLSFFSERPSSVLDDWSLILPYRNKNSTERRIENMSIGPFANWWTDISIAKHSTQDEWASPAFVYTYFTHWYNFLKNRPTKITDES